MVMFEIMPSHIASISPRVYRIHAASSIFPQADEWGARQAGMGIKAFLYPRFRDRAMMPLAFPFFDTLSAIRRSFRWIETRNCIEHEEPIVEYLLMGSRTYLFALAAR